MTTSKKLSTGVDARNVRNIILMRPINSMIEFKQIVGRGTRLFEGKEYFTIYDFVEGYKHFNDKEWDGEPLEPDPCKHCGKSPCTCMKEPSGDCYKCGQKPCVCDKPEPEPCDVCNEFPCVCQKKEPVIIKLADGKLRKLKYIDTLTFWGADGKQISAAQFIENLFGELPELFKNEDELRTLWGSPDTRKALLTGLEERGYSSELFDSVKELIDAENSDVFDVLAYVAFALAPISREERVVSHQSKIFEHYNQQEQFLAFVLDHYISEGVSELDLEKLPELLKSKYQSVRDIPTELGSIAEIRNVFVGFQAHLYSEIRN